MLLLHDRPPTDPAILDERRLASWCRNIEAVESLWDLGRMGHKIHLLFANTPELAAQNAAALKVMRKLYRERRKTLEDEARRRYR